MSLEEVPTPELLAALWARFSDRPTRQLLLKFTSTLARALLPSDKDGVLLVDLPQPELVKLRVLSKDAGYVTLVQAEEARRQGLGWEEYRRRTESFRLTCDSGPMAGLL